jgi:hypothetical protein
MSAQRKGRKKAPVSEETRNRMRLAWAKRRLEQPPAKMSPEERKQRKREQAKKRYQPKTGEPHRSMVAAVAAARLANLGRKRPPEVTAKIVVFHRGRKRSAETRAKLSMAAINRKMSACHNGHPYTDENTAINGRGHRQCTICLKAKRDRQIARRKR